IHFSQGDAESAFREFDMAIGLAPRDPTVYKYRAGAYWAQGDYQKAIRDATMLLRLDPSCENYMSRGLMYQQTEAFNSAIDDYSSALRLRPDHLDGHVLRGFCHQSRAIRHQKSPFDVYAERGLRLSSRRDLERAASDY